MILIITKVHCINTNLFKEFKEFHQSLGVDNRSTTAYYPESNGLVEAHNKILKRYVECFNNYVVLY